MRDVRFREMKELAKVAQATQDWALSPDASLLVFFLPFPRPQYFLIPVRQNVTDELLSLSLSISRFRNF